MNCTIPLYSIDIRTQSSGVLLRRQQYLLEKIWTKPGDMNTEEFIRLNTELFHIEKEIVHRGITSMKVLRKMNKHAIRMRVI